MGRHFLRRSASAGPNDLDAVRPSPRLPLPAASQPCALAIPRWGSGRADPPGLRSSPTGPIIQKRPEERHAFGPLLPILLSARKMRRPQWRAGLSTPARALARTKATEAAALTGPAAGGYPQPGARRGLKRAEGDRDYPRRIRE